MRCTLQVAEESKNLRVGEVVQGAKGGGLLRSTKAPEE